MSNLTVFGQFTPQRLIINGKPGIFLTPEQEKSLLDAMIDYKYCSSSILLKDSIIFELNKSIKDKNFEINLLTSEYNKCIGDAKTYVKNYNDLLEAHNKLNEDHNMLKITHSKSINWIIGLSGSTLVFGALLILTN
jgi:uncharacterized protein VirK/YbjX